MILINRLFTRREPEIDAKTIYIFCEGKKREYQYFRYFCGIDSRINIEVYQLQGNENNSPTGLYDIACTCLVPSEQNSNPKYEFLAGDEVWFVIDTDTWAEKISELKESLQKHTAWQIAQSNPCFEVWLYFHMFNELPTFTDHKSCQPWKTFISEHISGGFSTKRHSILIEQAFHRAETNYLANGDFPEVGSTQVFQLGKVILEFCGEKISAVLRAAS